MESKKKNNTQKKKFYQIDMIKIRRHGDEGGEKEFKHFDVVYIVNSSLSMLSSACCVRPCYQTLHSVLHRVWFGFEMKKKKKLLFIPWSQLTSNSYARVSQAYTQTHMMMDFCVLHRTSTRNNKSKHLLNFIRQII